MNETRRILLAVLGALSTEALVGAKRMAYAAPPTIPIERPVESPPPQLIADAEDLIVSALSGLSEDKWLTLSDMKSKVPKLQGIAQPDLELAISDLMWQKKLEQEEDQVPPRFRLITSCAC